MEKAGVNTGQDGIVTRLFGIRQRTTLKLQMEKAGVKASAFCYNQKRLKRM